MPDRDVSGEGALKVPGPADIQEVASMKTLVDVLLQATLAVIAIAVVICLARGWNQWGWIIAYWIVLSMKNIFDLYTMKKE